MHRSGRIKQLCINCGSDEFDESDLGRLICLHCGTQSQALKEELEFEDKQTIFSQVRGKYRHSLRAKRSPKTKIINPKLTAKKCLCGFQQILKSNAQRLVDQCSCPPELLTTTSELWFAFLKEWAMRSRYPIECAFVDARYETTHMRKIKARMEDNRKVSEGAGETDNTDGSQKTPLSQSKVLPGHSLGVGQQQEEHKHSSESEQELDDGTLETLAGKSRQARRKWVRRLQSGKIRWWEEDVRDKMYEKMTGPLRHTIPVEEWSISEYCRPSLGLGLAMLYISCRLLRLPFLPGDFVHLAANGTLIHTNAFNFLSIESQQALYRAKKFFSPKIPTYVDLQLLQSRFIKALSITLPPFYIPSISTSLTRNLGLPEAVFQNALCVTKLFSDKDIHSPLHAAAVVVCATKMCPGWDQWRYFSRPWSEERKRPLRIPWTSADIEDLPRHCLEKYLDYFRTTVNQGQEMWPNMTNHVDFLQEAAEHKIGMPEPQRSQTTSSDGFYEKCRFVTGLDSPVVNEWKRVLKQGENQIQRENVHSHLRKRRKYRHASLLTAQEVAKCQMSQKEMITEIPFSDFKKCLSLIKQQHGLRSNPLLNDTAGAEKYMVPFSEPWPESCWGVSLNLLMYEVRWNGLYTLEKPERYILLKRLGLQRIYPPWLKPYHTEPSRLNLRWQTLIKILATHKYVFGHVKVGAKFVVPAMPPWPHPMQGRWVGVKLRMLPFYAREFPLRMAVLINLGWPIPFKYDLGCLIPSKGKLQTNPYPRRPPEYQLIGQVDGEDYEEIDRQLLPWGQRQKRKRINTKTQKSQATQFKQKAELHPPMVPNGWYIVHTEERLMSAPLTVPYIALIEHFSNYLCCAPIALHKAVLDLDKIILKGNSSVMM